MQSITSLSLDSQSKLLIMKSRIVFT